MIFQNWLRSLAMRCVRRRATFPRMAKPRRRSQRNVGWAELLEDRIVPAAIVNIEAVSGLESITNPVLHVSLAVPDNSQSVTVNYAVGCFER